MADAPILHWQFEEDQTLTDRTASVDFVKTNGTTSFVATGLDVGASSATFHVANINAYMAEEVDMTIYMRFTPDASQAADAWLLTFSNSTDTSNMDVITMRSDDTFDWVRQRAGVPSINNAGPSISTTAEHEVAYYVSATNGNRQAINNAYTIAEQDVLYPTDTDWALYLCRQPASTTLGYFNGIIQEVRVYDSLDGGTGDKDTWIKALSNGEYPIGAIPRGPVGGGGSPGQSGGRGRGQGKGRGRGAGRGAPATQDGRGFYSPKWYG